MAVRFDATADRLLRTAGILDYNGAYSVLFWAYLASDLNNAATPLILSAGNNDSAADAIISADKSGTNFTLATEGGSGGAATGGSAFAFSVGTWAHLAMVRESATSLKLYANGSLVTTLTNSTSGRAAADRFEFGSAFDPNPYGEDWRFDGRVQSIKVYDAGLTLAEVQAEMNALRPVRSSNLWCWSPCWPGSGERAADYSGNGRAWTEVGTLTDEDPPPVSYGSPAWAIVTDGGAASTNANPTPDMVTVTESTPTATVASSGQSATITPPMLVTSATPMTASPAVTVVSCGTPAFTATNGATLAPTLPTGWVADDIHILLAARSDNTAMTAPGNRWTNLGTLTANNTTAQRIEVWWRRAQAGDTAPTLTFGSSTIVRGAIIIGVHGGTPSNSGPFVGQTLSSNAASATVTFATITPSEPNTVLLALYAYEDDPSAASTITGWQPFKVFADASGNDMALGYAHRIYEPDDTATGALSTTVSGGTFANSVNEGALLAIERTIVPPTLTPGMLTETVSLPTPTVATTGSAVVTPAMLVEAVAQTTSTVDASRSVVVSPAMLTLVASVMDAGVSIGQTATVTPDMLTVTAAVLDAAVASERSSAAAPAMLAATIVTTTASVTTGGSASVDADMLVVTVDGIAPTVAAGGSITLTPGMVELAEEQLDATVIPSQSQTVSPSMVAETLTQPAESVDAERHVVVAPAMFTISETATDATVSGAESAVIVPALLAVTTAVLASAVAATQSATTAPVLLGVQMLVLAAVASGPDEAPDIDGPTQVTLASTGQRRAILATTGLMLAVLTSTGVRLAATTESGVRQATLSSTGERDAETTNTGEHEVDTNTGVTSAVILR